MDNGNDETLVPSDFQLLSRRSIGQGGLPLALILERLDIKTESWIHTVLHFGSLFCRVAGRVRSILQATQRAGQQWLRGRPAARNVFYLNAYNLAKKMEILAD